LKKPLHRTVTEQLKERIFSDEYDVDDRLPAEPTLAKQLGVSRAILREGLKSLESEGLIYRLHGIGTFVKSKHPGISLNISIPRSITTMLESLGYLPGVSSMKISLQPVFPDDVERLNIPAGSKAYRIERVRTANGQPVAYTIDVVPAWVIRKQPAYDPDKNFSLFDHIITYCGITFSESSATLMPLHNVSNVAEKLEIDPSSHIFFFESIDSDVEGNPIIYSREYFTPWIFRFNVARKA